MAEPFSGSALAPLGGANRISKATTMALSREDFIRAQAGEAITIPDLAYGPLPDRGDDWPDYPDLRRAVDWFKTFLSRDDWKARRDAAFIRLHAAALRLPPSDAKGRFFDDSDTFGWYLFLADAFLDHIWNYEPMFGSRVVPVFAAIGRNLSLLQTVGGIEERVRRLATSERRQPNGGIFELLVAAGYRRGGGTVLFLPERPGKAKTHDMDVVIDGQTLAVECKRLEVSDYGDRERTQMRQLWSPAVAFATAQECSVFAKVSFSVPVFDVPETYLFDKISAWKSSSQTSMSWNDAMGAGTVASINLEPLKKILESDDVLVAGTRMLELLTGEYVRHANYLQATRVRAGMSPRYVKECDLAIICRWQTLAATATSAKAKDVLRKLSEANKQLPTDKAGIVHVGFEAVEGDEVERARYDKILATTASFDPQGKPLRYVYCHYFVPESPPDEAWAFDETTQWSRITGADRPPLPVPFLVISDAEPRRGTHWQ